MHTTQRFIAITGLVVCLCSLAYFALMKNTETVHYGVSRKFDREIYREELASTKMTGIIASGLGGIIFLGLTAMSGRKRYD